MEIIAYPQTAYGSLLSLYHDLDLPTIHLLEKAILQRNVRNYAESVAIFDAFPQPTAIQPAVVLEHTWTLIAQYRFREARRVAEAGLVAWQTKLRGDNGDVGPAILLRALLAGLDTLTDGSTYKCLESLEEIYGWLSPVPVTAFTDVQVSSGEVCPCPIFHNANPSRCGRSISITTCRRCSKRRLAPLSCMIYP